MTELSEKILADYQVRRTKKQKMKFISFLRQYIPNLKVEEGGFLHNRNIVVGDVEQAKIIIGAHYDTCALLPFPNFCMPKNIVLSILYSFLILIPFFLIVFISAFITSFFTDDFYIIQLVGNIVFWIVFIFGLIIGIPNKHTANDNTSGVITLCELITNLTEEEKKNIAFVFFDNEENGLFGSAFFASKYGNILKNKLIINIDCVSDGKHLLVVQSKLAKKNYGNELNKSFISNDEKVVHIENAATTYYPSDQLNFKNAVALSFMNKSKLGLYMNRIHTNRDVIFERSNIEFVCSCIKNFINNLNNKA